MLVPGYLHHGTQRGSQSMGPIFILRDLYIEHQEIHWMLLPQNGIMSPEIRRIIGGRKLQVVQGASNGCGKSGYSLCPCRAGGNWWWVSRMALAQGRQALLVRDYRGSDSLPLRHDSHDAEFSSLREGLRCIRRGFHCPVPFVGMGDRPEDP
jgi:hypothetical protein